jgi:methylmalonyl-CoA mutase N-terminal domain/subunit
MVEALTDEIERRAVGMIDEIDRMGGMIKAIENGFPQREIGRAAYQYQRSLETGERRIVGVNAYADDEEEVPAVFRVDPHLEKTQTSELEARRRERDGSAVAGALERLEAASRGDDNLFPLILESVKMRATIGEICGALVNTFGRYRQQRVL